MSDSTQSAPRKNRQKVDNPKQQCASDQSENQASAKPVEIVTIIPMHSTRSRKSLRAILAYFHVPSQSDLVD
jgi:hypothetical protein